jgi:hypothetical protein
LPTERYGPARYRKSSSAAWLASEAGRAADFVAAWRELAEWSVANVLGAMWAKLLCQRGAVGERGGRLDMAFIAWLE